MEITSARMVNISAQLPPEARKAGLEKRISAAELKLKELDKNELTERAQIDREIKKYKAQLEKIELRNTEKEKQAEKTDEEKQADYKRRFDTFECETCKNRRYQDDSCDSGVSFQTPTKIDPKMADMAVRSHENEHVVRNRDKAERDGMKIVSQSVTIQRAICPECGKLYTAGGLTRTRMKTDNNANRFNVGMFDSEKTGAKFNSVA